MDVRQLGDSPALRQLVLLGSIALAVALGLWVFRWSQQPAYAPLYSGLTDRDAADVAEALREGGIEFRFHNGAVLVPQAQVDQARLRLAARGLPRSGGVGFEMMQQDQGFGTSQFIESARYQHALETELARTISALQPVRAARVHLAIPKPSAFARNGGTPSASVLVDLHAGRTLEQNQVASIVYLVASSVAGMPVSAVAVIDQYGRLLSQNDGDGAAAPSAAQLEHTRRIESDYVRRINELLLPMLGPGRVSAQVTASVDYAVTEEARETYTPDPAKVRSEQISENSRRGAASAVGVPGAVSNQPPQEQAAVPLNAPANGEEVQNLSRETVRNYELDRTLSHTRQASGRVQRLSVAVLVDYVPRPKPGGAPDEIELSPLTEAELAKVEALVREAVGFDAERGDSVSVQNAPFIRDGIEAPQAPPLWQRPELRELARQAGGALLVLVLILFVLRPTLRQLLATPLRASPPAALAQGDEAQRAVADDRVALSAESAALPALAYENKLQTARAAVAQDPKRVAQVIKNWVGQEGG
ncbi:flagellar basal-body MS-ring/collar protein FliF [Sinimarinibacterium thermocellulolyticum]|uniref:flagellar basal-body MS-ring/collar protein FliF n=1 Tax=Sinimarinibacterium thermocellulolyticum TaxID=3170016 RepID=UPI003335C739